MNRLRKKSGKEFHSISLRKITCLGIKLTKEVKDLFNEKCKILKKQTKEDTRR
jgi:hypothetical protein